ncbi:MAG: LPXTG cell wall anchor domain-containing protein [Bacteroidales bacterium]|nr:LPXTG cell wall anchor domain-containing protein [Bacteroidales bacterium]
MKRIILLPHRWQYVGLGLLSVGIILSIVGFVSNWELLNYEFKMPALINNAGIFGNNGILWFSTAETSIYTTILPLLIIAGSLLIGFSKEKEEDELISLTRQTSAEKTILLGFSLVAFCYLFVYGIIFLYIIFYLVQLLPLVYVIWFKISLFRIKKMNSNEE